MATTPEKGAKKSTAKARRAAPKKSSANQAERLICFAGTTDGDVFYSDDEGEHWQTIIKGIGAVSKSHHYVNLSLDEQAAHH